MSTYVIRDNPFLYAENESDKAALQPYAQAIFDRVKAFPAYYPASARVIHDPRIQAGDIVSVVDDDGQTIRFPLFAVTFIWNGASRATYENTGGVTRQEAPAQQRELEEIKRKMLRAADLRTAIDSYLDTEEGIAQIESIVSGEFVTSEDLATELVNYVQSSSLDTKIGEYIDGTAGTAKIISAASGTYQTKAGMSNYATTTALASVSQDVSATKSAINMDVSYGSNTIGSNVKALLQLVANKDSASIMLRSDKITMQGGVTFLTPSDVGKNGTTYIDGGRIITGTITADKIDVSDLKVTTIYTNEASSGDYIPILTSFYEEGDKILRFGKDFNYIYDIDTIHPLIEILASEIYIGSPYTNEFGISFDTHNGTIEPGPSKKINLGDEYRVFKTVWSQHYCFEDGSYIEIYRGGLRFVDADGNSHWLT